MVWLYSHFISLCFSYSKISVTLRHHQTQVQDHVQQQPPSTVGAVDISCFLFTIRFSWNVQLYKHAIASIWRENMHGYLSADIICSEKRTVFREQSSSKTVSSEEQIMSKDNYLCLFLKPNVGYCVYYPSNIFLQGRILGDLFSKLLNVKEILSALRILLVCLKCLVLFILTIYSG